MQDTCDIAIIGGGAAGLAAAIFAAQARPTLRIRILDGARSLGAKILVSGGARCNVTHQRITTDDYNAPAPFVRHVLAAFNEKKTVQWFAGLGVPLKREETGKLFPVSDSGKTVLAALLNRCEKLDIKILTSHRVTAVERKEPGEPGEPGEHPEPKPSDTRHPTPDTHPSRFRTTHSQGTLTASRLIMATGGRSLPRTGSDGAGWAIVRRLGHTVTPTHPALVPLVLRDDFFHAAISGLALETELSTFAGNKRIDHRTGSLLFTHFGISGPVVMDASRHWVIAQAGGDEVKMTCSLLPGRDFAAVEKMLIDRALDHPKKTLITAIGDLLPGRMLEALLDHLRLNARQPMGRLSRDDRRSLVHGLTALTLPVIRDRGWNYAEVTAGGVPLNEVHHRDMQSRIVPGFYLIGEILDCDGRIGGFNFQWAWSTGFLAGQAAGIEI